MSILIICQKNVCFNYSLKKNIILITSNPRIQILSFLVYD